LKKASENGGFCESILMTLALFMASQIAIFNSTELSLGSLATEFYAGQLCMK